MTTIGRIEPVSDPNRIKLNTKAIGGDANKLDRDLHNRIIGQDVALSEIVHIYQQFLAGMAVPGRPVGSLLFLGPTGSGKTRTVEAMAESLVGDARAVIKIDCAEFQHSHEIAKLIGSPPGYLGHRETHPLLSQEVLNQYHTEKMKLSFVLFDEIEKSSDALWNLLLGILDKATLTLGDNRRVDFSRAMIFMTSNLGAVQIDPNKRTIGFSVAELDEARRNRDMDRVGIEAVRKKFTQEFVNRIDKICVYHPLSLEALTRILQIELNMAQQRIFSSANSAPFVFKCMSSAREKLIDEGYNATYNARHLKRAIDRWLIHPLCAAIVTGQIHGGDVVEVEYEPPADEFSFYITQRELPAYVMSNMVDASITPPPGALAQANTSGAINARSTRR
jgi:ATP-dependent Clp protease ATP-binding subunit ClpA